MSTVQTTLSPDDLPPRTTSAHRPEPKFELHREGNAYRVGHRGNWLAVQDMAGIADAILTIATVDVLRAGALR